MGGNNDPPAGSVGANTRIRTHKTAVLSIQMTTNLRSSRDSSRPLGKQRYAYPVNTITAAQTTMPSVYTTAVPDATIDVVA